MTRDRLSVAALGVAVGLVLSDSSIVILALPSILGRFQVPIDHVAWVLTLFNLVLAVVALPAAYLARHHPARAICAAGLVVFASASLGCALSPSFAWLLAARGLQAVGGAFTVCSALELLAATLRSQRVATSVWAAAGGLGAAAGPAVGGALTNAISWKAIFVVQAPLALAALVLLPRSVPAAPQQSVPVGRPAVAANLALALLSAALTAALFLVVLLLINGWGFSPLAAAAVVSVMPLAALLAYRLVPDVGSPQLRGAAGSVLVAGGLAALAVLPGASWVWLVAPQLAIGVGLALAIAALTEHALAARSPLAIHGGWTIASRHAGVCLGLLLLTPIFTGDLTDQQNAAELAGTRIILDSKLNLSQKLELGTALVGQLRSGDITRPPDLRPAFRKLPPSPELRRLQVSIQDQVDRAVTHAFSTSFMVAALLALAASLPLLARRVRW